VRAGFRPTGSGPRRLAMTPAPTADLDSTPFLLRKVGFVAGLLCFAVTLFVAPPEGMTEPGWRVCGLALWMALWWISEAMPLPVTALLPVTVLPLLGIMPLRKAASNFAAELIFLFLGGFLLSIAIQKWRVHERLGLGLLRHMGSSVPMLLAGLIGVTGFMGMWMANAATAMVMMPMALSIAALIAPSNTAGSPVAKALVLAVAYAPVIGGLSTFIGTPTNAVLEGFLSKTYGYQLSLAQWMAFGVPITVVLLIACWALLYLLFLRQAPAVPGLRAQMQESYARLGPFTRGEIATTAVFLLCVSGWVLSDVWARLLGVVLEDAVIAVVGALLLFILPLDRRGEKTVLTWKDTEKLPWGILLFFGGSLSLSAALTETGVTRWLSQELAVLHDVPIWVLAVIIVAAVVATSEMMSNSATVATFLPIVAGLCGGLGINPLLLMIPATFAASCAFMMPGASPPNAIAFATGYLKVPEMIRAGLALNLIAAIVVLLAAFYFVPALKEFDPFVVPEWAKPRTP
jgi:sodium-dependent dicarboxylate transporter 2/3/5